MLMSELMGVLKGIVRRPARFLLCAGSLVLGIGAATSVFSVVDAMLIRPLPYPHSDRLILMGRLTESGDEILAGADQIQTWAANTQSLEVVAGQRRWRADLTNIDEPRRIQAAYVTSSYFDLMGLRPHRGRVFGREHDLAGREGVAVFSCAFWKTAFGASNQTIGRTFEIRGHPYRVSGITDCGHKDSPRVFVKPIDVYLSVGSTRNSQELRMLGRLAEGFDLAQARAEIALLRLPADSHVSYGDWTTYAEFLHEATVKGSRRLLIAALSAACLGYLVAVANCASLLLGRVLERRSEIAIRRALGASRGNLAAYASLEAALAGLAGTFGGLLLTGWALDLFVSLTPANLFGVDRVALGQRGLTVAILLGLVAALMSGLPAVARSLQAKDRTGGTAPMHQPPRVRLLQGLVMGETAAALALLCGAILLGRTLIGLVSLDPGLEVDNRFAVNLSFRGGSAATLRDLTARLESLPQYRSAAVVSILPFASQDSRQTMRMEGHPAFAPGEGLKLSKHYVSPGYFSTLGIPLLAGRDFAWERSAAKKRRAGNKNATVTGRSSGVKPPLSEESSRDRSDPLSEEPETGGQEDDAVIEPAILSRRLAERLFGSWKDVVGRSFVLGGRNGLKLVVRGVVADVRRLSLRQEPDMVWYRPTTSIGFSDTNLVVWANSSDVSFMQDFRSILKSLNLHPIVIDAWSMEELFHGQLSTERFFTFLFAIFSLVSLVLAAIGIFGTMSFLTRSRTFEFGICLSLGASPRRVLLRALRPGLKTIGFGLAAGLGLAFGITRLIESILWGAEGGEYATFIVATLILAAVGLVAAILPARRVLSLDPAQTLGSVT